MTISSITARLLDAADQVLEQGRTPIVVLDLDGTLYDCAVRSWHILQQFARQGASAFPEQTRAISRLRVDEVGYLVEDALARVGVTDPYLVAQVVEFWRERFFTDEYVLHDAPIAGAVRFVQRLALARIVPFYLSGRDAPHMLVGTVHALRRDGFPVGTLGTRLVLKTDREVPDEVFKRSVVDHLRDAGEVIGAFDNEPGFCNLFREAFPEATVILLDTAHSPGAPRLIAGIDRISDFVPVDP
jgi:hypothetical protein